MTATANTTQTYATWKEQWYRKARAEGYTAKSALAIARLKLDDYTFPWQESDASGVLKTARVDGGIFTHVIRVEYDEDPPEMDNGHFARSWEPNAINSAEWQSTQYQYPGVRKPRRLRRRKDTYVRPSYGAYRRSEDRYWVPDESVQQIARYYNKAGYARHNAYLKALAQVRNQEEMSIGEHVTYYYVSVTTYLKDTDIEVASQGCGGVGIADDDSYLLDVARDLMHEAKSEAEENIPRLMTELHEKAQQLEANKAALEFYQQAR